LILLLFAPPVKGFDDQAFADVLPRNELEIVKKLHRHKCVRVLDGLGDTRYQPALNVVLKRLKDAGPADDKNVAVDSLDAFKHLLYRMTKHNALGQIGKIGMAQDDAGPARQSPPDRTPCSGTHNDDAAGRGLFKVLKIR